VSPIKGGGLSRAAKGAWIAARATLKALAVVRALAPRAVLSVGGYAAGPFSLAAALARAPLAILEPNGVMGFTNRVLAPVASRAYLAWPHLEGRARKGAARVLGVPLRKGFEPSSYSPATPPRVLVMGGSQGAEALNERAPRAIAAAERDVRVVHQTGKGRDAAVRAIYAELGLRDVTVTEFLHDVPAQLAAADLVLARSGAGTVAEVAAVGRASILVPFPFAADDHQAENARALERQGGCVCLVQSDGTVSRLEHEIRALLSDDASRIRMADAARRAGKPHAARDVATDLLSLAGIPPRLARGKGLNGAEHRHV